MTVLYIGNHTSSSKGYAAMARQIIKNGGNTFAFFTRNPRGGKAKAIDETDIQNFLVLAQILRRSTNLERSLRMHHIR